MNNESYHEHDHRVDSEMNHFTEPIKMLINYLNEIIGKEEMQINMTDFRDYYPLFVFDVSHQSERLKSRTVDIRTKYSVIVL